MKKNFMVIVALVAALFLVAPMTSQAADEVKGDWKLDSTGWWYEFEDGTYYTDGFYEIDGVTYYFDEVGYMATGWEKVGYNWYYFNASGAMVTDWAVIDGTWYYFDENGKMYEDGVWTIDEKLWLFDNDGAWMGTPGWNELFYASYSTDGDWYYLDANGNVCTGWQLIGGKWYYLATENDEYMPTGMMFENGKYFIEEEGEMVDYLFAANGAWIENTGWAYAGAWYYITADKEYATGWQLIGGNWYYFAAEDDEYMSTGQMYDGYRYEIEDKVYYFENSGAMVDGWYNYDDAFSTYGSWVYCYADGTPADKWVAINGKWYYFNEGQMLSNVWIDDEDQIVEVWDEEKQYYLGHDGAMVTGWYQFEYSGPHTQYSDNWIYTDPASGVAYTGWVLSGAKWYYIADGIMERSGAAYTYDYPDYPEYPVYEEFLGEDGMLSEEESKAWQDALDAYYEAKREYEYASEEYEEAYRNSLYVFGDDGAMLTGGWYQYKDTYGSTWYYANADGTAARGWKEISGKWYYFDSWDGMMYTNCYIDGCWLGADGAWVK